MKYFIKLLLLPIILSSLIYSANPPWNPNNPELVTASMGGMYWIGTEQRSYTYNTNKTLKEQVVKKPEGGAIGVPTWGLYRTTTYEYSQTTSTTPSPKANKLLNCKINNHTNTIKFQLQRSGEILLKISSLSGKTITSLSKSNSNNIKWNYSSDAISSGFYLYKLKSENKVYSGKLLIQK